MERGQWLLPAHCLAHFCGMSLEVGIRWEVERSHRQETQRTAGQVQKKTKCTTHGHLFTQYYTPMPSTTVWAVLVFSTWGVLFDRGSTLITACLFYKLQLLQRHCGRDRISASFRTTRFCVCAVSSQCLLSRMTRRPVQFPSLYGHGHLFSSVTHQLITMLGWTRPGCGRC